ncbi:hypothetical protein RRF57_000957 [Xylaria bambusicola]|uniref:Uncharacterized protein n=1 Tax=Xylaria bambusicola TaxID=326684 RepID=A0AAN7UG63_9PEZI
MPSWMTAVFLHGYQTWDQNRWSVLTRRNERTVLSTMEQADDIEKLRSNPLFREICEWDDSGQILITPGSVIGRVSFLSAIIEITRDTELKFQEIRDSEILDEEKWYLLMELWIKYIRPDTSMKGWAFFLKNLRSCLDTKKCSEMGTVEHHLLARARKTALWSNDRHSLVRAAVDEASIVDGRRIAVYESMGVPSTRGLAIVPHNTGLDDLLVDLRGGRVPFTIWVFDESSGSDGSNDGSLHCRLIGESLANRMTEDTTSPQEGVFWIH